MDIARVTIKHSVSLNPYFHAISSVIFLTNDLTHMLQLSNFTFHIANKTSNARISNFIKICQPLKTDISSKNFIYPSCECILQICKKVKIKSRCRGRPHLYLCGHKIKFNKCSNVVLRNSVESVV